MMDVILCPAAPEAASQLGSDRYLAYMTQWNLLDYPALVFPVTRVDPSVDVQDEWYLPINEKDRQIYHRCRSLYFRFSSVQAFEVEAETSTDDRPETYAGAPVSLQLIGRRYEDEKVDVLDGLSRHGTLLISNRSWQLWNLSENELDFHSSKCCNGSLKYDFIFDFVGSNNPLVAITRVIQIEPIQGGWWTSKAI